VASRVLSAEFYPGAYYSWRINGPFADSWLNDPSRVDPGDGALWVTHTEHTDVNESQLGLRESLNLHTADFARQRIAAK
jgi:hypothetical protein